MCRVHFLYSGIVTVGQSNLTATVNEYLLSTREVSLHSSLFLDWLCSVIIWLLTILVLEDQGRRAMSSNHSSSFKQFHTAVVTLVTFLASVNHSIGHSLKGLLTYSCSQGVKDWVVSSVSWVCMLKKNNALEWLVPVLDSLCPGCQNPLLWWLSFPCFYTWEYFYLSVTEAVL